MKTETKTKSHSLVIMWFYDQWILSYIVTLKMVQTIALVLLWTLLLGIEASFEDCFHCGE